MPQISPLNRFKRLMEGSFPQTYDALRWWGYRRILRRLADLIVAQNGLVVQNGPFQGMQYIPEMLRSEELVRHAVVPKLLGSYEAELHAVLRRVVERGYDTLVNIGCSEGYYAIGLSLRLPRARIFAFDLDPNARDLCERMVRLNGVEDRVTVGGECANEHLQRLATAHALVVCDCEGCELALLRPDLVPGLADCDLIVELHDCIDTSITTVVLKRFASTHEIQLITSGERDATEYPPAEKFSAYEQRLALKEVRWGTPPVWAFMVSKESNRERPTHGNDEPTKPGHAA